VERGHLSSGSGSQSRSRCRTAHLPHRGQDRRGVPPAFGTPGRITGRKRAQETTSSLVRAVVRGRRRSAHLIRGDEIVAQAQSPHERDDHSLAKMKSTEDGHGTRREGRFRRAISRMVKSQTSSSPESEQGHPVHQPVHPHSRNPDQTSDGEETAVTEPPTGPFSASAENGYRPTSRASVPNPYTTRSLDVDDVDTGANPVGQWRGVGLDEPAPRSPHHQMRGEKRHGGGITHRCGWGGHECWKDDEARFWKAGNTRRSRRRTRLVLPQLRLGNDDCARR
jgi:hypothetical protein